ncbi:MAG: histidine kinase N-terminal 7TM domain-containing protein, partial [Anaerolineae bacterium]
MTGWIAAGLDLVNQILAAIVVLTSFSLLIYLITYNVRSRVARAFCALLTFVLIVYAGDVILYEVQTQEAAIRWLKFQWVGIAFVPAAYLHFSDALLHTINLRARWRQAVVILSYVAGTVFLGMVLFGELLVYDGVYSPDASHLRAGPFFWVFAAYYGLVVLWGAANMYRARQHTLTRASRRRMAYLGLSFVAPAAGVFPYLMVPSLAVPVPANLLQLFLLVGNVAVLLMIVVMAYSVAYFGSLSPDRIVK